MDCTYYTQKVNYLLVEKYFSAHSIKENLLPELYISLNLNKKNLPGLNKGLYTTEHGLKYFKTKKLFNKYNLSEENIEIYKQLMLLKKKIILKESRHRDASIERNDFYNLYLKISKILNYKLFEIEHILDRKIYEKEPLNDFNKIKSLLRIKYGDNRYWINENTFNIKEFLNKNTYPYFIGMVLNNQKGHISLSVLILGIQYNKNLYNLFLS